MCGPRSTSAGEVDLRLQGRDLTVAMTGEDVKQLQVGLRQLGFTIADAELQRQSFGELTQRAVQEYQRQHDLPPTGVVDQRTAEIINAAVAALEPHPPGPAAPSFTILGHVHTSGGDAVGGCVVHAFDRDMRSKEPLGDATTAEDGRYEIQYTTERFARAEKDGADLAFEVSTRDGLPLKVVSVIPIGMNGPSQLVPGVVFNTPPNATVDLVVEARLPRGPSEFELLVRDVTPLMQGVEAVALTDDDTAFLSAETGIARARLSLFAAAARLGTKTASPATAFYGIGREGVPIDLATLASQSPALLGRALRRAVLDNIVPATLSDSIDTLANQLHQRLTAQVLNEPPVQGAASLGALLTTIVADVPTQQKFLSSYAARQGTIQDFWKQLRSDPTFGRDGLANKIQRTLQLAALTRNHLPLVTQLQKMFDGGELKSLRDLAQFDVSGWLRLLKATGQEGLASIPSDVTGKDDGERAKTYVSALADEVTAAFPSAVVARELLKAKPGNAAGKFIADNQDFEFNQTHIDTYLSAHAAVLPEGAQERTALALELKRMQRVFTVAPRPSEMLTLLDAGIQSARGIARMGQSVFVARFGKQLGAHRAQVLHGRAVRVTQVAATAYARYAPAMNSLALTVTRSKP
jgi:hypothetical protein